MRKYILFTDLDRTLIPNGTQPESPDALERFRQLVERDEITLVYVTGRHRTLIEQAIVDFDLPQPDFVISDVGSTIYRIDATGWHQWGRWDAHISPDWCGHSHIELYQMLSVFSVLRLQEAGKQNRHKLSFYVARESGSPELMAEIDARLKQAEIRANLIWSIDELTGTGLLDILPASASKLRAIEFLMAQLGYTAESAVFAGDSGNDLDVLCSHIPAVLVANADEEVRRQTVGRAEPATLYVARGGFLGMNGNYSAGILEGLAHYWPETNAWLHVQTGRVGER